MNRRRRRSGTAAAAQNAEAQAAQRAAVLVALAAKQDEQVKKTKASHLAQRSRENYDGCMSRLNSFLVDNNYRDAYQDEDKFGDIDNLVLPVNLTYFMRFWASVLTPFTGM